MLTKEQNDELTRVGPGTPMGDVLRHYWYPVAFTRELDEFPVKKARLLGEDWAVFKTAPWRLRHRRRALPAPRRLARLRHRRGRRAALRLPRLEVQHRRRVRRDPRRARLVAGVPRQVVRLRRRGPGARRARVGVHRQRSGARAAALRGLRDGRRARHRSLDLPCNWLQIMENAVDPYHVEALHGRYFEFIADQKGFEMPSAFQNKHERWRSTCSSTASSSAACSSARTRPATTGSIGHPLVFPYQMWVGGNGVYQMQIRVPVDDTTTWMLFYTVHAPEGADAAGQPAGRRLRVPVA